jgi:PTH1 family peptidyl-tRNA hydrolase
MKFLIAGLGNPGSEYAHTRHNIGFDVVQALVQKHGAELRSDRLAFVAEFRWKGKSFVCICPTTFMNLSGRAVRYWMDKEKVDPAHLLVIIDDIALPLSKLRLRPSGSDAGHNGLKSVEASLGTHDYPRLRFGVGNDFPKGHQADYVLGHWKPTEEELVKLKIEKCVEVIERFATEGLVSAMNQVNRLDFTL